MTTAAKTEKEGYEEFCNKLYKFIPQQYFVTDLKENKIGHIKIALVREVINKLIIRSTDMEATITMMVNFNGKDIELIEIPARKFKSREKLLGVEICRKLNVMPNTYHYNLLENVGALKNSNSILFGDTVTKGNTAAGFSGRVIYDWAYSLRDKDSLTEKLQHNSMGEDGTILKSEGDPTKPASNALHQTEYINQGTFFSHFVTLDNVTPGLFLHLLYCLQHQHTYGAQSTTNSENMNNYIVAIGFNDFEKPVNSFSISKEWNQTNSNQTLTLDLLKTFVIGEMEKAYSTANIISDKAGNPSVTKLTDLLKYADDIWNDPPLITGIYQEVLQKIGQYGKDIKLWQ